MTDLRQIEREKAEYMKQGIRKFRKVSNLLEAGALLLTICIAGSANAAEHPGQPAGQAVGQAAGQQAAMNGTTQVLPVPGSYKIDPAHSFAYFGARHHVVGLVRGRFDKVTGTITASKDLTACSVDVTIDVASISTQIAERDKDLLGDAYFEEKKFPVAIYRGRGIRRGSGGLWTMDGSLTMHGVTQTVPLTFTFKGLFPDTPANQPARAAFHGFAGIKRADFNMGARDNLEELGASKDPDVEIEIDVEADASPATH
jgi:polyisoprenoid-binding protein YceI